MENRTFITETSPINNKDYNQLSHFLVTDWRKKNGGLEILVRFNQTACSYVPKRAHTVQNYTHNKPLYTNTRLTAMGLERFEVFLKPEN